MIKTGHLRCEYLKDPVGIDQNRPRLSWTLESAQRDQIQTAYQILLASESDFLRQENADSCHLCLTEFIPVPICVMRITSTSRISADMTTFGSGLPA